MLTIMYEWPWDQIDFLLFVVTKYMYFSTAYKYSAEGLELNHIHFILLYASTGIHFKEK